MENLRANHFESRDSGLNKNKFNLSAKSGRSVGKGKLCAAKIIRVVTVPPVFAALLTTILYIAMGDAAFANRFHYAEAVFSLSLLPVVPYALCAVIPALKKRGRKFERTVALIFSVTGYFMGAAFAFFGGGVQVEKVMFATYLCSGLLLAILSFIFKYRASGHACGVAGPVAMLTAYLGAAFLPAALLFGADRHIIGSTRTAHCASSHNRFGGFGYFVWGNVSACACARIIKRLNALKIIR